MENRLLALFLILILIAFSIQLSAGEQQRTLIVEGKHVIIDYFEGDTIIVKNGVLEIKKYADVNEIYVENGSIMARWVTAKRLVVKKFDEVYNIGAEKVYAEDGNSILVTVLEGKCLDAEVLNVDTLHIGCEAGVTCPREIMLNGTRVSDENEFMEILNQYWNLKLRNVDQVFIVVSGDALHISNVNSPIDLVIDKLYVEGSKVRRVEVIGETVLKNAEISFLSINPNTKAIGNATVSDVLQFLAMSNCTIYLDKGNIRFGNLSVLNMPETISFIDSNCSIKGYTNEIVNIYAEKSNLTLQFDGRARVFGLDSNINATSSCALESVEGENINVLRLIRNVTIIAPDDVSYYVICDDEIRPSKGITHVSGPCSRLSIKYAGFTLNITESNSRVFLKEMLANRYDPGVIAVLIAVAVVTALTGAVTYTRIKNKSVTISKLFSGRNSIILYIIPIILLSIAIFTHLTSRAEATSITWYGNLTPQAVIEKLYEIASWAKILATTFLALAIIVNYQEIAKAFSFKIYPKKLETILVFALLIIHMIIYVTFVLEVHVYAIYAMLICEIIIFSLLYLTYKGEKTLKKLLQFSILLPLAGIFALTNDMIFTLVYLATTLIALYALYMLYLCNGEVFDSRVLEAMYFLLPASSILILILVPSPIFNYRLIPINTVTLEYDMETFQKMLFLTNYNIFYVLFILSLFWVTGFILSLRMEVWDLYKKYSFLAMSMGMLSICFLPIYFDEYHSSFETWSLWNNDLSLSEFFSLSYGGHLGYGIRFLRLLTDGFTLLLFNSNFYLYKRVWFTGFFILLIPLIAKLSLDSEFLKKHHVENFCLLFTTTPYIFWFFTKGGNADFSMLLMLVTIILACSRKCWPYSILTAIFSATSYIMGFASFLYLIFHFIRKRAWKALVITLIISACLAYLQYLCLTDILERAELSEPPQNHALSIIYSILSIFLIFTGSLPDNYFISLATPSLLLLITLIAIHMIKIHFRNPLLTSLLLAGAAPMVITPNLISHVISLDYYTVTRLAPLTIVITLSALDIKKKNIMPLVCLLIITNIVGIVTFTQGAYIEGMDQIVIDTIGLRDPVHFFEFIINPKQFYMTSLGNPERIYIIDIHHDIDEELITSRIEFLRDGFQQFGCHYVGNYLFDRGEDYLILYIFSCRCET